MEQQEIHKQRPVLFFQAQPEFFDWLAIHFDQDESVWIKLGKKHSGIQSITYEQARETAIIYGWIDGLINRYDESHYLILFSPRRRRSNWSKINRAIATTLIQENRMHAAGLAQVEAARADGRWEAAYDSSSTITVPEDLQAGLDRDPEAQAFFDSLSRTQRYAFLYRIQSAVKPETRQRRLETAMQMLRAGQTHGTGIRKKK